MENEDYDDLHIRTVLGDKIVEKKFIRSKDDDDVEIKQLKPIKEDK